MPEAPFPTTQAWYFLSRELNITLMLGWNKTLIRNSLLWSMWSQRVRHHLATEQQKTAMQVARFLWVHFLMQGVKEGSIFNRFCCLIVEIDTILELE